MLFERKALIILALAAVAASADAIGIDGTAEGGYGGALWTQSIGTGFGDSNQGSPVNANGSELDGFYGLQDATNLYGVGTGNLESGGGYNHEVFFIDTGAGGFNTVGNDNASSADFGFLNGNMSGLTFDTGFNASYALWVRNGNNDANNTVYVTLAKLGPGGGDLFDISATGTDTTTIRTPGTAGFASALNQINTGGVDGSNGGASSGAGVTTGYEFAIDKTLLGSPTGPIKIAGFITGGNYLSNQVIGGLPNGYGNLGNGSPAHFENIEGNQFVTVPAVPEPATMAVLGLGVVALLRRRRK